MSTLEHTVRERMAMYGVPDEDVDSVIKALHPAWPHTGPGWPDSSAVNSMRPEYRSSHVVSAPPTLGTDEPWDLLIFKPPVDSTALVWAAGPAGVDFRPPVPPVDSVTSFVTFQEFSEAGGTLWRSTAGSTFDYPATQYLPATLPAAWRKSASSITAYLTSSDLYNSGTVFASQWMIPFTHGGFTKNPTGSGASPFVNPTVLRRISTGVPFDENTMTLSSPSLYTSQAKLGAYLPLRLCGPDQPFVAPLAAGAEAFLPNPAATGDLDVLFPTSADVTFLPALVENLADQDTLTGQYVRSWVNPAYGSNVDNVATGVVIFRGLHRLATVTIKTYDSLEIATRYNGPSRQFMKTPREFSPRSLEAYYRISHSLDQVYPASFNSLGSILATIGKVIMGALPVVGPVLSAAVPLIEGVVSTVRGARAGRREIAPARVVPALKPLPRTGKAARRIRKSRRG